MSYEFSIESDESGKRIYSNDILRNVELKKRPKSNFKYEALKEQPDFLDKQDKA